MSHSLSGSPAESPIPADFDSLALLVRQTIAHKLRKSVDEVDLDASFETLGVDSLDLAELFFLLEERMGTPMELDFGLTLNTVRDVVNAILSKRC